MSQDTNEAIKNETHLCVIMWSDPKSVARLLMMRRADAVHFRKRVSELLSADDLCVVGKGHQCEHREFLRSATERDRARENERRQRSTTRRSEALKKTKKETQSSQTKQMKHAQRYIHGEKDGSSKDASERDPIRHVEEVLHVVRVLAFLHFCIFAFVHFCTEDT